MTAQMFFALTYVPCVACVGMAYAFDGFVSRVFKTASFIFGLAAVISYIIFIGLIW